MQQLLEFSVDLRQQTQCQDCIQCGTTMCKSGLVRPVMLLRQGVKSGEEDMCKYFAWDWQKGYSTRQKQRISNFYTAGILVHFWTFPENFVEI